MKVLEKSMVERAESSQRVWKVIQFPLTRMVIATLFVTIGVATAQLVIGMFGAAVAAPADLILSILIALLTTCFSYRFYVQWIEKRQVTELRTKGMFRELITGLSIGSAIVSIVIGILWILGSYHLSGLNPWVVLIPAAAANVPSGFVQEILFRGILFRITEESLGTWIAMMISTLLFGSIHAFSSNATVLSTLSIMLEAGILLTGAYILTKRLWLAIGIHIAWDFAIDGIFGIGTSALSTKTLHGLLQGKLVGNDLLTGGIQGVEASLVAVLLSLAVGCFLTWFAWRGNKFVAKSNHL